MNDYDIYIFNLNDTLIRSFGLANHNYYHELTKYLKIPIPKNDNICKNWGTDFTYSLENIFLSKIDNNQIVIDLLSDLRNRKPLQVINNIIRIVTTLKKHNKWICLYSSSPPEILITDIKYGVSEILDHFNYIYSTTVQHAEKPSNRIVEEILEQFRIERGDFANKSKVILIGDSVNDYFTALNAGVSFAAILTGITTRNEFIDLGLNHKQIYSSILDVFNLEGHGIVSIIKNEKNEFLLVKEGRKHNKYFNHWSGPHGRGTKDDILEEEIVVRETREECNIEVIPLRKLYTCSADSKIKTVSFWEAKIISKSDEQLMKPNSEISQISWIPFNEIISGDLLFYPGTKDFFNKIKT